MCGDQMKVSLLIILSILFVSVVFSSDLYGDSASEVLVVVNNEAVTLQDSIDSNAISVARGQSCGSHTCIQGFDEFGVLCAYASPIISVGSCSYNNKCSSYSCGKGCTAWLGCWSCSIISGRDAGTGPIVSGTAALANKGNQMTSFIESESRFDCPAGTTRDYRFITDGWVCRR
jgi:hypothetical protein